MSKILMILLSLLLVKFHKAQVIINVQLPQVGLNFKNQLWNMTLINTGASSITVKINMVMTDISNGQQVLSAATNLFQLPQGTKVVQYNDVIPVNYTVLNNSYNINGSSGGYLPIGNFNICFEVEKKNIETYETLAEECTDIQVEPLGPPNLNSPDDQSEIDDRRPFFTWSPPTPVALFQNLSYEIKLVEVLTNQSDADAIQQNIPVISQQNITSAFFQYPISSALLDTGKIYAWQVTAANNNIFVAKSEIWTFKEIVFGKDNIVYEKESPYFKLKMEMSSAYFLSNGVLKFEYTNELNDSLVTINIYDITTKNKVPINLNENVIPLKFGQNLIDIDLISNGGFTSNHLYLLELSNSKNENWKGRFRYKPTN